MNSKVVVLGNEAGGVINVSKNNPDYGFVRVKQVRTVYGDNGFVEKKPIEALIQGTIETLKDCGYYEGQELPGKIIAIESLEPFNKKQPLKGIKSAGDTGVHCTFGGQSIYRKTVYTEQANAADTLIKHDNVEEISAAYAALKNAQKSTKALQPNENFDL